MNRRSLALAATVALAACSHGPFDFAPLRQAQDRSAQDDTHYMQGGAALGALNSTGAGKIQHVVWIVQENRSFNDIFEGYPGAYTVSSGKDSHGNTIQLQPVSLKDVYEIDHTAPRRCLTPVTAPESSAERIAGWTDSNEEGSGGGPKNPAVRLRAAFGVEAVLGHGARVRAGRPHVPVAARRELRRAPIHHRRAGAIERRRARRHGGAARAAAATRSSRSR